MRHHPTHGFENDMTRWVEHPQNMFYERLFLIFNAPHRQRSPHSSCSASASSARSALPVQIQINRQLSIFRNELKWQKTMGKFHLVHQNMTDDCNKCRSSASARAAAWACSSLRAAASSWAMLQSN
jgi:hypothetical protein